MPKKDVDQAYEELQKKGQATVENIVKWMKQAKILEKAQKSEEEASKMLASAEKKAQVSQEKFNSVMLEMAEAAKMTHEQMYQQMAEASTRFVNALMQAAEAFSSTIAGQAPTTSKK